MKLGVLKQELQCIYHSSFDFGGFFLKANFLKEINFTIIDLLDINIL